MYGKKVPVPATALPGDASVPLDSTSSGITGRLSIQAASGTVFIWQEPGAAPTAGTVKANGFMLVAGAEPIVIFDPTNLPDPKMIYFASTTGAEVRVIA